MGILIDALAIISGCIIGGAFKEKAIIKNMTVFGIGIMIISMSGFFENIYNVSGMGLKSDKLTAVVISLITGSLIGEALHIGDRLGNAAGYANKSVNAFIDSVVFFGVGGLQISGAVLLAMNNDSSQLFIKGLVDFPFAIMFGATYGKIASLSAFPVALLQGVIFFIARFFNSAMNETAVGQICAIGYIVLFFTGYNLISEKNNKINNINMLPSLVIIIILNLIYNVWRNAL